VSGDDGGVSAFRRLWRERVKQRERDLPQTLIRRVKAKRGTIQVLNRAHVHLGRASAHKRNISSRRCIHSTLYAGSRSTSRRFVCIASETPQKRLTAAVRAIFVSACRLPTKLPKRANAETQVLGGKSGERASHIEMRS